MERINVFSCGGGTQSICMARLIIDGKLPKPDLAVIVDTEYEASSTWSYYEEILKPELAKVGVDLVRVPKSDYATYGLYGNNKTIPLPPFFTLEGRTPSFCSSKWKVDTLQRYCNKNGAKGKKVNVWIGFTIDEQRRCKRQSATEKWLHTYPLIDLGFSRDNAIAYVIKSGWEKPPRSSCWMCPNRSNAEWQHLKQHAPKDLQRAATLEREINENRKKHGMDDLFLHRDRKPIDKIDFRSATLDFWETGCDSGMCFI